MACLPATTHLNQSIKQAPASNWDLTSNSSNTSSIASWELEEYSPGSSGQAGTAGTYPVSLSSIARVQVSGAGLPRGLVAGQWSMVVDGMPGTVRAPALLLHI